MAFLISEDEYNFQVDPSLLADASTDGSEPLTEDDRNWNISMFLQRDDEPDGASEAKIEPLPVEAQGRREEPELSAAEQLVLAYLMCHENRPKATPPRCPKSPFAKKPNTMVFTPSSLKRISRQMQREKVSKARNKRK